MKKLIYLFAGIMTVMTVWLFTACSSDSMDRVSERRSGYYTAQGEGYTVTAVSGVRESSFKADGKVGGGLKPYTLITLVPDEFDIDAVITYTAEADGCMFGGTMTVHPFAASFSAEFEHETKAKEFTVTVRFGGNLSTVQAKSQITSDMITYDRAISAAKTALSPRGEYEVRARIIKNPFGDGVCWHISFITADGDTGVLLDPTTAKVLAKK
ncbi:MAG: hypothetical protein J1F69_06245 [Clostridiales bacterium]|nr:hypothetical protein [Clostridiales bacterium]